jgi:serine/threonine protein kinase
MHFFPFWVLSPTPKYNMKTARWFSRYRWFLMLITSKYIISWYNCWSTACVQMILQLAVRLKELHALGYVHRDLKPGNVMWLPRENRWTVIDFGCVARIGESARLGFSVKYAAPEVIAAYRSGAKTMIVQVRQLAVQVSSCGVSLYKTYCRNILFLDLCQREYN